jgi:hypothetical protein
VAEKLEPNYHDEAVLITSFIKTEGGQALLARWARQKKTVEAKIARNETDLEVAAVEKKGENITIVVLNKDELKIRLSFLNLIEKEFKDMQIEAAKKQGE